MARDYTAPRTINRIATWMSRLGVGSSVELVTIGRKSRQPRSVPVSPIDVDGVEYIVAPYGSVSWVQNVREEPIVTIRRGKRERPARLTEVTDEAATIVAAYYERESFPRKYMDVPDSPTLKDFENAAASFPVFKVEDRI